MKKTASPVYAYIVFMILMVMLGASDSMKGVFAPVFRNHFHLDSAGFSFIVTVSYIGNLVFMLFGSRFADRFGKKAVFTVMLLLWLCGILLYTVTDSYGVILVCMFITMGTSTLMSTMINIMTPLIFAGAPALVVNTLFFVQGIGTSGSQAAAGKFGHVFGDWQTANLILLIAGAAGLVLFHFMHIPENTVPAEYSDSDRQKPAGGGWKQVLQNKAFIMLFLMFGFYFVAEHGILNWLVLYCGSRFGFNQEKSALYLSLFFGGITVGRLVLAPAVQKFGIQKSLMVFGGAGAGVYVLSFCAADLCQSVQVSSVLLYVLAFSGFILSILYPTMVLFIRHFYSEDIISTATGAVISAATLFDILFNLFFGAFADAAGFTVSILVLPLFMILYFIAAVRLCRGGRNGTGQTVA